MNLIVCIENNAGISFNDRRVSRDIAVSKDILSMCEGKTLYTYEKSLDLFDNIDDAYFKTNAVKAIRYFNALKSINGLSDEFLFVEDNVPNDLCSAFSKVIIYKWNRDYPYDVTFDFNMTNFRLQSINEFSGNSHDKITREVYVKI